MNKTALKNFAVWARNKLIADISYRAGLMGITESGIASALPQSTGTTEFYDIGTAEPYAISGEEVRQRERLVALIKQKEQETDYKTAYDYVIEEVAYTWFNRLIAIRFMEVNDYLPSHIRVLSSESGKMEPDLVTTPFDADLQFSAEEEQLIISLKQNNKLDELFKVLLIKQCNTLNEVLPELFEKTSDYTELLLNISFIDHEGVVWHLLNDIDEADFNVEKEGQVEIIGWLYQYYISEKHDQIINIYKGTIKKEDIPAATQLFTTDWVVRYMVDNSLGRYWIERNTSSTLKDKLEFFVTPKNGEIKYVNEKIEPQDLAFLDPCMGSGHILVYAFDVLMEIYREVGYTDRDAAKSILENNIFGLDIDKRAYQLAYFSLLMKARSYNRRILTSGIEPNVCAIEESNSVNKFAQDSITVDKKQNIIGEYLLDVFKHAKEIGSLQTVEAKEYKEFSEYLEECGERGDIDIFSYGWTQHTLPLMKKLCKQAEVLSRKYHVVCTNPPYLGKLEGKLKDFVVDRYKPYFGDLFSVFMHRNFAFCVKDGFSAFMTPNVWMHLKSYETLRKEVITSKGIESFIYIAKGSFYSEATVDVCSFVLKNGYCDVPTVFFRLDNYENSMEEQGKGMLHECKQVTSDTRFDVDVSNLLRIPGSPLSFWSPESVISAFESAPALGTIANPCQGLATTNNGLFLRLWHEVNIKKVGFECKKESDTIGPLKWFPINKGGEYRKWYGNNEYVINFQNEGKELCDYIDANSAVNHTGRVINRDKYFKPNGTWSAITSSSLSVRYSPPGYIISNAGMAVYSESYLKKIIAFLNSKITTKVLVKVINESLNFNAGDIVRLPFILVKDSQIDELANANIDISAAEWDSYESSWDFVAHPLVLAAEVPDLNGGHKASLSDCYEKWKSLCNKRFNQLKANEEELNRIFIDIYGLQGELTPEVEDKDVTVRKADLQRDIKSLLSYAVGCMFGRYSLDEPGLAYAGGTWDASKYSTFIPDKDNCIPITDEEYFEDDIVGQFIGWMKKAFGTENLEKNLDFIANALGNKGKTSREVIRNYFLNDFIKDHIKIYQKRPIYWMFDSGKQNGFKALIYMHRYDANTIGNMRIDYLHRMQRVYESEINRMKDSIDHSTNAREVAAATKRKEKLQKQLKECREYDEKIGHLALSRINIDLDDGVKVNYEKVQTASDGKKYQVLAKI